VTALLKLQAHQSVLTNASKAPRRRQFLDDAIESTGTEGQGYALAVRNAGKDHQVVFEELGQVRSERQFHSSFGVNLDDDKIKKRQPSRPFKESEAAYGQLHELLSPVRGGKCTPLENWLFLKPDQCFLLGWGYCSDFCSFFMSFLGKRGQENKGPSRDPSRKEQSA
jgi:hypothetical protein